MRDRQPLARPTSIGSFGPFLIGFGVVLVARVVIALSRLDEFRGEELYIGSLAHALAVGMPLDTSALPVISHLRGSVIFGLLTVPVFAITGPTMIGLKTVACLWSAITGGLFAHLCGKAGGGRVAVWVGALLFAFMPPSFQMVEVLALGSHGDVSLIVFAALALLLGGNGPLTKGRAVAFGATLGFGVLFSLQFVVALPGLALAWIARDPGAWKRKTTALVALMAALFAAPSIWLSRSADLVNKPVEEHLLPDGVGGVLPKLGEVVTQGLPDSWLFAENGGAWLAWPYAIAILIGLGFVARRAMSRDRLALHALVHPAIVLAAFSISDFELNLEVTANGMGSRYFMPILPFLVLGIALGAQRLWVPSRRLLASLLVLGALTPGLLGWGALVDLDVAMDHGSTPTHGTSFPWFGTHLEVAGGDDTAARLEWSRRADPDWDVVRPLRYTDIVATPAPELEVGALQDAYRRAQAAGPLKPYLCAQLGRALANWKDEGRRAAFLGQIRSDPDAAWVDRALGSAMCETAIFRFALLGTKSYAEFDPIVRLSNATDGRILEGAGFRVGLTYSPYNDRMVEIVERMGELPVRAHGPFLRGLAYGYRCRFVEASYEPPSAMSMMWGLVGWQIASQAQARDLNISDFLFEPADSWKTD